MGLSDHAPSRRAILKASLAGSFIFGFSLPIAEAAPKAGTAKFAPNAFIRIDPSGKTTFIMPQVEMGQGVYTSIAMILAEDLCADWSAVALEHAPPSDKLYGNPMLGGLQATGNSNSIRAFWRPLRTGAASARQMLIQAAARQWKVEPASCAADKGIVIHHASGRKLKYGALAGLAAKETAPKDVALKDPKDFTIIGRPIKRLDTPAKVNGGTTYGIDVRMPGLKFATLAASPTFGGKVANVDDTAAKQIPGVRQVVVLDDLVAVVGDHMWAAKQGLSALKITWDPGPHGRVDMAQIRQEIRAASDGPALVAKTVGDVDKALADGRKFEASYELPFLAHATMEPLNCTIRMTPRACELWLGTQIISRVQSSVAAAVGLPIDKVTVHNHILGGGFGRRLEPDMAVKAARIAQHVNGPVKVVWTREEDIQQDIYRPIYFDRLTATVKDGAINGWNHRITGSSIVARWLPPAFKANHDIDGDMVDGAVDMPYAIPNLKVEAVRCEPPGVPTGFWRGVGPNNNVFAVESFLDEVAKELGKNPVEFRRSMLAGAPRLRAALDLAAKKAGWGQTLPPRHGLGVSCQVAFGSFIATVAHVEVAPNGEVKLHRLTSAVDTGIAVNPDTIVAQLQGGLIFGATAALYGEITIKNGRVEQSNFHNYRMLRMNEAPAIDIYLIRSGEAPGGIGETGTTAAPPAIRNAIYAATGVPLRTLPIDRKALAAV